MFLCALLLVGISLCGQDTSGGKKLITFKVTFSTRTDQQPPTVYLVDVSDSAAVYMGTPVRFRALAPNAGTKSLSYDQIEVATVQRKGAVGRGILFGGLGGMVLGGIIGAITYKPCNPCFLDFGIGFDIMTGSSIGLLGGGLIGGITGALSKKIFRIGGNKEKFQAMRLSVLDRAYK